MKRSITISKPMQSNLLKKYVRVMPAGLVSDMMDMDISKKLFAGCSLMMQMFYLKISIVTWSDRNTLKSHSIFEQEADL